MKFTANIHSYCGEEYLTTVSIEKTLFNDTTYEVGKIEVEKVAQNVEGAEPCVVEEVYNEKTKTWKDQTIYVKRIN